MEFDWLNQEVLLSILAILILLSCDVSWLVSINIRNVYNLQADREKLVREIQAREQAERKQREYEDKLEEMQSEMERARRELMDAQDMIRRLEQQLRELQAAKDELDRKQRELEEMTLRLREEREMEESERRRFEDEITRKEAEVSRIRAEVNANYKYKMMKKEFLKFTPGNEKSFHGFFVASLNSRSL